MLGDNAAWLAVQIESRRAFDQRLAVVAATNILANGRGDQFRIDRGRADVRVDLPRLLPQCRSQAI